MDKMITNSLHLKSFLKSDKSVMTTFRPISISFWDLSNYEITKEYQESKSNGRYCFGGLKI